MLLDRMLASAQRYADRCAVHDEKLTLTYDRLSWLSGYFARHIHGTTQAPTVGLMFPACAVLAPVFFGCRWAGHVAVPLNFLLQPAELVHVVRDSGIDCIYTVRHFEGLCKQLGVRAIFVDDLLQNLAGKARRWGWLPRSWLRRLMPRPPRVPSAHPDDLAVLIYTSGTSGKPKGVMLSECNLATNVDECIAVAGLRNDERFLGVLPMFHGFGLTALLLAPITVGARTDYLHRFNPVAVADYIRQHRVQVFMGVPGMFHAIHRLRDVAAESMQSLELAVSGGEALPAAIHAGWLGRFGVNICEGYGLTETSPVLALNTPSANRPGTVGRLLPSVEAKIVHHIGIGATLPADQQTPQVPGELFVRGPSVFRGYYHNPEQTAAAFDDGWFRTGDIATIATDGFLRICGRCKELIIVAGENVYPAEVEEALCEHPAVSRCAVLGRPDELRGEVPVAFVTLSDGATASDRDLREFLRSRIAGYKIPREIIIDADLPVGPTGKIVKRELHQRIDALSATPQSSE